ncbi:MAG: hypothetical protein JSV80_12725 [Acidobacteriota bacterium]|nr:MAG: hypothetical protein JSV80_12725 [Acidobacteriota bacterium]
MASRRAGGDLHRHHDLTGIRWCLHADCSLVDAILEAEAAAAPDFRLFLVRPTGNLTLVRLTLRGGQLASFGAESLPLTTGDQSVTTLPDLSLLLTTGKAGGEHHRPEFGNTGTDAGESTLCASDDQLDF